MVLLGAQKQRSQFPRPVKPIFLGWLMGGLYAPAPGDIKRLKALKE
jgi:hypothetical protein